MAWTSVITNGGLSLLAEGTPQIESVWGGSGTVKEAALLAQTALAEPKQQGSIIAYETGNSGGRLKLQFGAADAEYTLRQIGIFAKGTGAGESILFALLQNPEGIKISAKADWPSFVYTHYCQMNLANAEDFTVNIDSGALVSLSTLQEALAYYVQLDSTGKIPDDVLPDMDFIPKTDRGKAGGVASLNTFGKIPLDQLVIDTALSATSGNPVQNKIVQAAIEAINTALGGKAASNHGHTLASLGAAAANHSHTAAQVGAAAANHSHTAAQVGAAASNHTHTAAALSISLQSLGGCRIVTGIYTGNGLARILSNNVWSGGQFINLGATPKYVIVGFAGWTSWPNKFNQFVGAGTIFFATQDLMYSKEFATNSGGASLMIADQGFYVGGTSDNQWGHAVGTNIVNAIYAYAAII